MPYDPNNTADLVESLHQPWRATVAECLRRWRGLDRAKRSGSYLVVHGDAGARATLDAAGIAGLAARLG